MLSTFLDGAWPNFNHIWAGGIDHCDIFRFQQYPKFSCIIKNKFELFKQKI